LEHIRPVCNKLSANDHINVKHWFEKERENERDCKIE
jgi:hypothetical protein